MAYFGASTIEEILSQVKGLLETYQGELELSLNLSEDSKLAVNLKSVITVVNELDNDIETKISFTKEKIVDSIKGSASEESKTTKDLGKVDIKVKVKRSK